MNGLVAIVAAQAAFVSGWWLRGFGDALRHGTVRAHLTRAGYRGRQRVRFPLGEDMVLQASGMDDQEIVFRYVGGTSEHVDLMTWRRPRTVPLR